MKKYYLVILLLGAFQIFSQNDKIGYSKTQIIDIMDREPCKISDNQFWYCEEDGDFINYTFKNNFVSSVMYMWEYKSKYEADQDVKNEISKAKNIYGRPEIKDNQAFWFVDKLLIHITYGYKNGKHYSCLRISER